jgi:hypothetical protein
MEICSLEGGTDSTRTYEMSRLGYPPGTHLSLETFNRVVAVNNHQEDVSLLRSLGGRPGNIPRSECLRAFKTLAALPFRRW